jgi:transposase
MGKDKVDFEQVVKRGCGIDVHKEQLVATIKGTGIKQETRTYDCFTESLESLKKWLQENRITHVAMESTGVYWKPVYNIFEDCFVILLVNARHIKNVPGHKTDKKDSAWIAKLLLSGLLKGSFIPPKPIRELRDLTRYRKKIVAQIASEKNRLHRILEDANIKLSSVISDMSGATATRIINAMIDGEENIEELLKLIHAGVKSSKERLAASLHGCLTKHHKVMLRFIKQSIVDKERLIEELDEEIHQCLKDNELEADSELLQTIPGVGKAASIGIISEIGTDMDIFPDEKHLASWAGMCPGSNESAGKKKIPERPTEINT